MPQSDVEARRLNYTALRAKAARSVENVAKPAESWVKFARMSRRSTDRQCSRDLAMGLATASGPNLPAFTSMTAIFD